MTTSPAASERIIGPDLPRMSPLGMVGWKVMGLRNRIDDLLWERRLRIKTRGALHIHIADAYLYDTFAYFTINRVLDRLDWQSDDVFVDIGCGKGRVVCCAAMRVAKKILGVDLDKSLCDQARRNAEHMRRRRTPIEIIHAPAQEVDYSACTKFFLFNPFGVATLRLVLASIAKSLRDSPRAIELAYVNPAHDHLMPEMVPELTRFDQWRWRPWGRLKHDVSLWRNHSQPGQADRSSRD